MRAPPEKRLDQRIRPSWQHPHYCQVGRVSPLRSARQRSPWRFSLPIVFAGQNLAGGNAGRPFCVGLRGKRIAETMTCPGERGPGDLFSARNHPGTRLGLKRHPNIGCPHAHGGYRAASRAVASALDWPHERKRIAGPRGATAGGRASADHGPARGGRSELRTPARGVWRADAGRCPAHRPQRRRCAGLRAGRPSCGLFAT